MNKEIIALAVNNTIQLAYGEDVINIQKDNHPDLFETVFDLVQQAANDPSNKEKLCDRFFEFKEKIRKHTKGNFYVEGDGLRLKGDDELMPDLVASRLKELVLAGADYKPLISFWKNLKNNPDPNVRHQLYAFMTHNNIPITENGWVVCEKGVDELPDGRLVDGYTGKIDNSIGMRVRMDRSKVVVDPTQTCQPGLHVGAPNFVRNWWSSDVIVTVIVNPADFVSIPRDYNQTKARVCEYIVIGLSDLSRKKELVYNFEDIVVPTYRAVKEQKNREKSTSKEPVVPFGKTLDDIDFSKMTAKAIMEMVNKKTNVKLKMDPKNKKSIIKAAEKAFTIDVSGMQQHEIYITIKQRSKFDLKDTIRWTWRKQFIEKASIFLAKEGFKLIDNR